MPGHAVMLGKPVAHVAEPLGEPRELDRSPERVRAVPPDPIGTRSRTESGMGMKLDSARRYGPTECALGRELGR